MCAAGVVECFLVIAGAVFDAAVEVCDFCVLLLAPDGAAFLPDAGVVPLCAAPFAEAA